MIVPHADYRVNPRRALYVTGIIDENLLASLTPDILRLQQESRKPITVFIDSPGGKVGAMETILRLLKLSDQDSSPSCRLITAVTSRAASAAADLLSSGDYALAYPTSTLLFHGTRNTADTLPPLTAEMTSLLGRLLRQSNDRYAMGLAHKIEDRFAFRFMFSRGEFPAIRAEFARPSMTDLECFVEYIRRQLTRDAEKMWGRARDRHARYKDLFDKILKNAQAGAGNLTQAEIEAERIKAMVDFEVATNKDNKGWTFTQGGLDNLTDDFFLLNEYLSATGHERLRTWSLRFGKHLLGSEETAAIDAIPNAEEQTEKLIELVRPIMEPVWSFFFGLCHALQDGENELDAWDAYWLGLVDEVVGSDLLSIRTFVEYKQDEPAPESDDAAVANPATLRPS